MKVGKHTYNIHNINIQWPGCADVQIGSFCSIANNLVIYLGGNHRTDWITTYPFGHIHCNIFNRFSGEGHPSTNGNVIIGNDVWIGNNVTIMSGVNIGDGCVIAANSHVVKDTLPYSIVGGNPAKVIKRRFADNIIERLLQLKWWDMEDSIINEISPLLCSSNFDELFQKFNI